MMFLNSVPTKQITTDWITRPWMRGKLFYTSLFTLLSLIFIGANTLLQYQSLQNFILNEEREAQSDFNRHERSLHEVSNLIYTTAINTDEVKSIYRNTLGADEKQKAKVREALWNHLRNEYTIFHTFRIQQLHFQLPDNESFLRFHKREKFGDNLSGIRPTIEYVNRTLNPISGFEEGRIFNGFRYVYPLIDHDGTHLGSVEVSSSALSYKEAFELDEHHEMDIVLREDLVKGKVFESEQDNYVPYPLNPRFLIEKTMVMSERQKSGEHDHQKSLEILSQRDDIAEKMGRMERFTIFSVHDGDFDLVTFLPISNAISSEKVAYAVIFRESPYLLQSLKGYLFEAVLALSAALGLTIIFYIIQINLLTRRELEKALIAADEANRAKDAFLSNMSHELRTPLNAIIGFSQVLNARPDVSEAVKKMVEKIHISGKNLLALVNTLLDFSKIESGKTELSLFPFEIKGLMYEVKVMIEPMAHKKGLTLHDRIPEELILHADRQLIKQVFINLLSNAVKFSHENGKITLEHETQGGVEIFHIRDEGLGIPVDKIETLFEPFVQIREHQNSSVKGTGLGLSIIKKIIELHGGKVWVESTVGEGSCFSFTLPSQRQIEKVGESVVDTVDTVNEDR